MELNSRELIRHSKNNALTVAALVIALVIARNGYRSERSQIENLKKQIENAKMKNTELLRIEKIRVKLQEFRTLINNKNISLAINKIGGLAKASAVNILIIKPGKEETLSSYVKYPFDLTISAKTYHAIGKFVSILENSDDIYVIKEMSIKASDENLEANLQIFTILVTAE